MVLVDFFVVTLSCFIASLFVMSSAFIVSIITKRIGVADAAWGLTFIAVGIAALVTTRAFSVPMIVSLLLVIVWGSRLAYHVIRRLVHAREDDRRYTELAKKWPAKHKHIQLFSRVFFVQSVLAVIVMIPVIVVAITRDQGNIFLTAVGAFIWVAGFLIESVADKQLARFVRHNPGKLMHRGLWQYSRHPNYFGEIVQWFGIAVIALGVPGGWLGLIGPLTITALIIFISGIPPAEKNMSKKPEWKDYASRTSVLIPLPPRS